MIKKDRVKRGGVIKTHIRVVEGYRPGPGLPTKQRTIKSFGYLEDQPDPEAFMAMVAKFDDNFKDTVPLRIEVGFWGILKREMYYARKFTSKTKLMHAIRSYIHYYNFDRLQRKLDVMTPYEYHKHYRAA